MKQETENFWNENRENILSDYAKGLGVHSLERKYGLGHSSIHMRIKREGIPVDKRRWSYGKVRVDLTPCEDLYYVLGVIYGDGSAYSYRHHQHKNSVYNKIQLSVKDKDFAEAFMRSCKKIGLKPNISKKKVKGWKKPFCWRVEANSKVFVEWYKLLNKEGILNEKKAYRIAFIRGLFDSDGCFYKKGMYAYVYTTKDDRKKFIIKLVESIGFNPRAYWCESKTYSFSPEWQIRMDIKDKTIKFLETIQPNIERKRVR